MNKTVCGTATSQRKQADQPREVGQGARVVKELVSPYGHSGRNVVADNLFSSVDLAQDLLADGLTCWDTPKQQTTRSGSILCALFSYKQRE